MPTYPRTTLAAIAAAMAGTAGAVVIAMSLITAAISGQAVRSSSFYSTSTASNAIATDGGMKASSTIEGTTLVGTTGNITTLVGTTVSSTNIGTMLYSTVRGLVVHATTASSTNLIIGQGATIIGSQTAILTLSPDAIGGYQCTSTATALSGAVSGNAVLITPPFMWTTSTVMFKASGFAGTATVQMCNTSSSAITLTPSSALRITTVQY